LEVRSWWNTKSLMVRLFFSCPISDLILASHLLFGAIICLALYYVLRFKGIVSLPTLFYPFVFFMTVFPDIDHLHWVKIELEHLVPFTIWDLFEWGLRVESYPKSFLHYWIYPVILLFLLVMPLRDLKGFRWFLFGAFLGWTVHLMLDGVIYIT